MKPVTRTVSLITLVQPGAHRHPNRPLHPPPHPRHPPQLRYLRSGISSAFFVATRKLVRESEMRCHPAHFLPPFSCCHDTRISHTFDIWQGQPHRLPLSHHLHHLLRPPHRRHRPDRHRLLHSHQRLLSFVRHRHRSECRQLEPSDYLHG